MMGRPIRLLFRIAVCLLLVLPIACSQSAGNPADQVMKSFAGKWKVVSLDRSGRKSDAGALKDMTVSVEGDKFTFTEISGGEQKKDDVSVRGGYLEEYVLQVNPANSGEIDFVYTYGENLGKSRPGLYALEGETLKLSYASAKGPRPTQFTPGKDVTVYMLERLP